MYFLKLHSCVYLSAKFEVSSIILTSFTQGEILAPPPLTSKRTPKKPTQITVNILIILKENVTSYNHFPAVADQLQLNPAGKIT